MLRKLKNNSLLTGSAIYLFSNILNASIPFVLLPVFTRFLTPAEYGEVAMFQTLLGALGAFVGLNVTGAAARKYYDSHLPDYNIKKFIAACLQVLIASSLVVFGILYVFQRNLSEWLSIQEKWVLWSVFVSSSSVIFQIRLAQWQVRKAAFRYGFLQISYAIFFALLSLLLVVVLLLGAEGRLIAQASAAILFGLIAFFLLRQDDLLSFFVWKPAYVIEALRFGVPLVPHISGMFLLLSVDRFVINTKLGLSEAGIYMVAVQIVGAMTLIFDAINKAFVPWLFEQLNTDSISLKIKIVRYTYLWYLVIIFGTIFVFLYGHILVNILVGPEYSKSGAVIGWLALGQAFHGMYLMVTSYVFYTKRTSLLSLVTISSGILNIFLLIYLISLLGLEGAAVAFFIAMGLRFIFTWWVAHKCYPMPWFSSELFKKPC